MNFSSPTCETESHSAASFDVYNIETALPAIDLEALENHLRAAKIAEDQWVSEQREAAALYRWMSVGWTDGILPGGFVSCGLNAN